MMDFIYMIVGISFALTVLLCAVGVLVFDRYMDYKQCRQCCSCCEHPDHRGEK